MKNIILNNINNVQQRINVAEQGVSRRPGSVHIVAVSKTRQVEEIQCAWQAGLRHFGENYLQEALPKIDALSEKKLIWHYIGSIQSNKTRLIAEHFDWVHTIESTKIARRLALQRPAHLPALSVCLQINISDESSKSGISVDQLSDLAKTVQGLPNIKLRGLMAVPAKEQDVEKQRAVFHRVFALYQELIGEGIELDTLSMGMSGDFEAAIFEGATLLRLGTAIFGPRRARSSENL